MTNIVPIERKYRLKTTQKHTKFWPWKKIYAENDPTTDQLKAHDKVYLIGFGVRGGGGMAEARLRTGGGGGDRTQRSFITKQ